MSHAKKLISAAAASSMLFFSAAAVPAHAAPLTESQISAILNLISNFGADVSTVINVNAALRGEAAVSRAQATTADAKSGCVLLTRDLSRGSTDNATNGEVSKLQKFLSAQKLYSDEITGFFGPVTKRSVEQYQRKYAISPADGYVGEKTRASIAAVSGCGGSDISTATAANRNTTAPQSATPTTGAPTVAISVNDVTIATNNLGTTTVLMYTSPKLGWSISGMPSGAYCSRSSNVGGESGWIGQIQLQNGASMGSKVIPASSIITDYTNRYDFQIGCRASSLSTTSLASATTRITVSTSTSGILPPPTTDENGKPLKAHAVGVAPSAATVGTEIYVYGTGLSQLGEVYGYFSTGTTTNAQGQEVTVYGARTEQPGVYGTGSHQGLLGKATEYIRVTIPSGLALGPHAMRLGTKDSAYGKGTLHVPRGIRITNINPVSRAAVVSPNGGETFVRGQTAKNVIEVRYTTTIVRPSDPRLSNARLDVKASLVGRNGEKLSGIGNWSRSATATTTGSGVIRIPLFTTSSTSPYKDGPPAGKYKMEVCIDDLASLLGGVLSKSSVCDTSDAEFTIRN